MELYGGGSTAMQASSFFGTIFRVDGTWYARHEGGGGVLLPVETPDSAKTAFVDGQSYNFTGRIIADHRGHPRSAYVSAAEAIGRQTKGK